MLHLPKAVRFTKIIQHPQFLSFTSFVIFRLRAGINLEQNLDNLINASVSNVTFTLYPVLLSKTVS